MELIMKKQVVGHGSLAYQDEGQGHPLLLSHSFLWDSNMWAPQIQTLKQQYRCIAPDLWSHGQSDPLPQATRSIEDLANDHYQFANSLSLQKFGLVGLSVGAMWATHLALSHPESVSVLVIMDSYLGSEPFESQRVYFDMMDQLDRDKRITTEFADMVAPYFFARETAKENPALVHAFIQRLINTRPDQIQGISGLGRAIFSRNCLLDKLPDIKVPTLIVVGEDDMPRPPSEARKMAELIPNAELAIIPKAGHICTLEQPALVNEVLQDFLSKHIQ